MSRIPKLQHTIIRASAGTGKTYQLAIRFIALLLLQSHAGKVEPERLSALTFTRKGAAEFASRILSRLAGAAISHEECGRLQNDLEEIIEGKPSKGIKGLAPGVVLKLNQTQIRRVLAAAVDHLDRLCLGTIDSFMARSVQTLAFELGLGGFEILDEPAAEIARRDLLAEVFRQAANSDLEAFYQTFKRASLKSSASPRKDLDLFARSYHSLVCAIRSAEAWGGPAFWGGDCPVAGDDTWKNRARQLAEEVAMLDFGHRSMSASFGKTLTWLAERNCDTKAELPSWLDEGGIICRLWANWPEGDGTVDYQRKARRIPAEVMRPLKQVLTGWVAAELRALADKTQALHQVIAAYEDTYEAQSRSKGRLAFSDLPLLLRAETNQGAAEAIELLGFRWYQQFDHWLLDEFQDTSRVQWSVLQPWLDEAIQDNAGTKSVFVVGDIKQSIYGWRGGEPRLFRELVQQYQEVFCEQLMFESWRSRPAVLELANVVCCGSSAGLNDAEKFNSRALARWEYQPHEPSKAKASRPGYAAVLLADETSLPVSRVAGGEADDAERVDERMVARAEMIREAIEQIKPLERGMSCAILTRKTKNAQGIAQWLRAHGQTRVMVEGDATLVDQSPTLSTLLDALRWLDTPAHEFAAGHVLHSPLWNLLEEEVKADEKAGSQTGRVWRHWRDQVNDLGATAVTRAWCADLLQTELSDYSRYCVQQVDQLAHRLGVGVTLAEWIVALENFTVRETSAPGSIHIMTIHKAKGLGFDVVFLPDLDIGKHGPDRILVRKDARGAVSGCLVQPPKWLTLWEPVLAELRAEQEAEDDLEALCVLYVALTRAKEATFLIAGKEKDARSATRAREWILEGIRPSGMTQASPWGVGELVWERGSQKFWESKQEEEAIEPPPALRPLTYDPDLELNEPGARRERKKPSDASHAIWKGQEGGPGRGASTSAGQNFGTEVHKVFEQIEWWNPAAPDLEGSPAACETVRKCLEVPEIRDFFDREGAKDEALREIPVEFIEREVWWSGIVDRLVMRYGPDGNLRRAIVLDFKTDKVQSAGELKARYQEQVAIYRRALESALKLTPEIVLLSTHLKAVVRL